MLNIKKITLVLGLVMTMIFPTLAKTATIPYGVSNGVPLSTVTNIWGWSIVYSGGFGDQVPLSTVFNGIKATDHVMLASMSSVSKDIDVLAAALLSDVTTYTPLNVVHFANGANWYYNGWSMGFAGDGDTIRQGKADYSDMGESDRLSWHTSNPEIYDTNFYNVPESLYWGWRSGINAGLGDATWTRIVFVDRAIEITPPNAATPEPGTMLLMGIGIAGAAWMHRRKMMATS